MGRYRTGRPGVGDVGAAGAVRGEVGALPVLLASIASESSRTLALSGGGFSLASNKDALLLLPLLAAPSDTRACFRGEAIGGGGAGCCPSSLRVSCFSSSFRM